MNIVEFLALGVFSIFLFALFAQGLFNLYISFYSWDFPERIDNNKLPKKYAKPRLSFSVFIPARHEAEVIGETLRAISNVNYPKHLVKIMPIFTEDDTETIAAAQKSAKDNSITNIQPVIFGGKPGKSKGMNIALAQSTSDVVVIFDAEDDMNPSILNIANTVMLNRKLDVLQCGVQLMDYDSHWFSLHNVLEYYFWFKSRMHYFAARQVVPLGGNTVFFRKESLQLVNGWDEDNLTEDADIGIRLSAQGANIGAYYHPSVVTREETPESASAFVKQRTRWIQGFLQVMAKRGWQALPSTRHKILSLYILFAPIMQAILMILAPFFVYLILSVDLPLGVALISFLPMVPLVLMLLLNILGMEEFAREQNIPLKRRWHLIAMATFIPYQFLLGFAAARATWRELRGQSTWEKTLHRGAHRTTPITAEELR